MKHYLSLIKFSHTIFALPFALVGFFLAAMLDSYSFSAGLLVKVVLCMIFARSAAMAFNRWLDRDVDLNNPRTAIREIPAGILKPNKVLFFVILNSVAFIITTSFINTLCFTLSPVALFIILGYSFTKRFTAFCHLVLGLGISLAPIGAYLAVAGRFDIIPILFSGAVLTWVAGFDIIYALQDDEFDQKNKLNSIPVALGRFKALNLAAWMHLMTVVFLISGVYFAQKLYDTLGWLHWLGAIIFIFLLIYQHRLVKADDLSKINLAFFTTNGVASVIFGMLFIIDLLT